MVALVWGKSATVRSFKTEASARSEFPLSARPRPTHRSAQRSPRQRPARPHWRGPAHRHGEEYPRGRSCRRGVTLPSKGDPRARGPVGRMVPKSKNGYPCLTEGGCSLVRSSLPPGDAKTSNRAIGGRLLAPRGREKPRRQKISRLRGLCENFEPRDKGDRQKET